MSTHVFTPGTYFAWQSTTYVIHRLLPEQQVVIEQCGNTVVTSVPLVLLVQALFDGTLHVLPPPHSGREAAPAHPAINGAGRGLDDYSVELVQIARARLDAIRPLLDLAPRTRTRALMYERVREVQAAQSANHNATLLTAISVSSLYRWLADYRRAGKDLRALIPATHQRGGKGRSRLTAEVEAVIDRILRPRYLVREAVTIDDVWHEIVASIADENQTRAPSNQLTVPSRTTVARRIEHLDLRERVAARQGSRSARQAFAHHGQRSEPTLPLERVELDHTRVDLIVVDEQDHLPLGRPTLTYCLDIATRYPLGLYLGFEPPSYLAVMECLAHAIRPKPSSRDVYGADHDWQVYGLPTTLVVDNGKEFTGHDLQDACDVLGVRLVHSPVQTPQFKAGIERLFGTMNTRLFHTLPGTTFGSVVQRGDYDSLEQACISLRELQQLVTIFVVDIYAEQFHRGLNGVPARCWEQAVHAGFVPRVPARADEVLVLLGRSVERVIQAYGVEFESLRYNCAALAPLRQRLAGKPVKVKYHPADLSRVYVYDPFEQQYLPIPALAEAYTQGLSLWKHRVIRRTVLDEQQSVDLAALGQAKRKLQEIVAGARTQKRLRTRAAKARWEGEVPSQSDIRSADSPPLASAPLVGPPVFLPELVNDRTPDEWSITYPTLLSRRRQSPPLGGTDDAPPS